MDAATRRLFVAAIVVVIVVTGGAALIMGGTPPAPTPSPASSAAPGASGDAPGSPIRGVIVAVDSRGLDDVRSFTLRADDGSIHVFDLRELQDTAAFPLGHLAEHQATAEPVLVAFREQDGVLLATGIDDA
jgi:hypothetical protein